MAPWFELPDFVEGQALSASAHLNGVARAA